MHTFCRPTKITNILNQTRCIGDKVFATPKIFKLVVTPDATHMNK